MPFRVDISPNAEHHFQQLRKVDQSRVLSAIESQLTHEPLKSTRNRKPMRSNLIATRELRVGNFRVYYDVDEREQTVLVRAIGVKHHGKVSIGGEEVDLS